MPMTDEQEREAITAAMARLFAGTPTRSSGNLDILTLAAEAGLKRNKLTHKHTDLRNAFYKEKARCDGVPERETKLRAETDLLKQRLAEIGAERDNHRAAAETFARAIHVLTLENEALRKEIARASTPALIPLQRT